MFHACMNTQLLSHVQLLATPWTVACQAPLSMGFSRQEYWSGLPFPSPESLPGLASLESPALVSFSGESPWPGISRVSCIGFLLQRVSLAWHLSSLLHWQRGSLSLVSPGCDLVCTAHPLFPPVGGAELGPPRRPWSAAPFMVTHMTASP